MSWKLRLFKSQGLVNLATSQQLLVQTLDDILLFFNQAEIVVCHDVLMYRLMQINKASLMHKEWSQHKNRTKQDIYSVYARLLRIEARLNMLCFLMKHQQVILLE
jgi:hypothetical protein